MFNTQCNRTHTNICPPVCRPEHEISAYLKLKMILLSRITCTRSHCMKNIYRRIHFDILVYCYTSLCVWLGLFRLCALLRIAPTARKCVVAKRPMMLTSSRRRNTQIHHLLLLRLLRSGCEHIADTRALRWMGISCK